MTRPSSHEDLDEYDSRGHVVATIPADYITKYPSLGQHLLAALAEAAHLGLEITDDSIVIPLTMTELDRKLKQRQDSWDYGKQTHDKYLEDGEWPTSHWIWNAYLKAEGIDAPKKEEAKR